MKPVFGGFKTRLEFIKFGPCLSNKNHIIARVLPFPKCGLPFLCFHDYRRCEWFCSEWDIIIIITKWNLNLVLNISGIFESKQMADHILEFAGLWLLCDYCFIKNLLLKSSYLCWMSLAFFRSASKTTFKLSIDSYYSGLSRTSLYLIFL